MIKRLLVFLLLLSGCSSVKETPENKVQAIADMVYSADGSPLPPLNTTIKLTMYDEKILNENMQSVNEIVSHYHALFDGYHDFENINNVKTINDAATTHEPIKVDKELVEVIETAIRLTQLSEGKFNLTIEPLYQVYKPLLSLFPIVQEDPDSQLIKQAQACVVHPDKLNEVIVIDKKNNTVQINEYPGCDSQVQITLGAISKGYVTDKLIEKLNESNVSYLLDVGSSNIYGQTSDTWKVGVRSPYNKIAYLYPIALPSKIALSTSGDDQNYYIKQNEDGTQIIRSHIIDSTLGYSPNYYRNVSVITESNMLADAMSTILFTCKDNEEILKVVQLFEKEFQCHFEYGLIKEINATDKQLSLIKSKGYDSYVISDYMSPSIIKQEVIYE